MNSLSRQEFKDIGEEVLAQVPLYDLQRHQPLEALETGVGNCAAKAAIAAGILVVRHEIEPVMGWNVNRHGKMETIQLPLGDKQRPHIGHIDLITAVTVDEEMTQTDLYGMAYGMRVPERVSGQSTEGSPSFGPINSHDKYAQIANDGTITDTRYARRHGYKILDWKEATAEYMAAIHEPIPDFKMLLSQVRQVF